jgi:NADPH:quinone reductase-like Zn-dependent oxidoreductase
MKMLLVKAVRLHQGGVLTVEEIPAPRPGAGEAVVRVHAAGITRDELDWPTDRLPATPSYELSGVVEEVGTAVDGVAVGDAVYALTPFDRDGAAAELALVPVAVLAPKPRAIGHVESAALPLAGLSAWQGLFDHGGLEAGERVLVVGPAGGVGHVATQLARERGAHVIDQSDGATEADLVFDTAGGDLLTRALGALRPRGRLVSVAAEPPPELGGTYFVVEPNREQLVELARSVDSGSVRPSIDSVFPLEDVRAAFERLASRGKRGKVVLEIYATE